MTDGKSLAIDDGGHPEGQKPLTMSGQSGYPTISSAVESGNMVHLDLSHAETEKKPRNLVSQDLRVRRGVPLPFGATPMADGINFAVFSKSATAVTLVLFPPDSDESCLEVPLDPRLNRTGQVWHVFVPGLSAGVHYGFCMQPTLNPGNLLQSGRSQVLIDPYAHAISTFASRHSQSGRERCAVVVGDTFDWKNDQPLNRPLAESVIYELHVRGFTAHPSAGNQLPGTFAGLVERIPYLNELGITAVELLPITDFDENDCQRTNPSSGERLVNYWGYHPIGFFALQRSYASDQTDAGHVREFKEMVKSLHAAGIEVILDVVFNHTAEGDESGPTFSFRGIDSAVYYMIDPNTGKYLNYSGCGNTLNCNHPLVRDLICDCLRYWVTEMHVDGFRFDLASILGRGRDGAVLASPPLLERLAADSILANTKLIAEAWDAAGLYQVGSFPAWGRWAEWNGRFRDDVRRFIKGDPGMAPALATRLYGSPDLYQSSERQPYHSINFVTCHDGFTLADLVSYNAKHNEPNGEDNTDGTADNLSWNCGYEGLTDQPGIIRLRRRQTKNFATILMVAHGVPMILAGDEFGRTQQGNSNAYCQDNPVSWIDWDLKEENADLFRFFRLLIAFRRTHAAMRRISFAPMPCCAQVAWHGVKLGEPDWSSNSRSLAMHRWATDERGGEDHVYFIANAHWDPQVFDLPTLPSSRWYRFVDTMLDSPDDIAESNESGTPVTGGQYEMGPRSVVILESRPRAEAPV
jgi:glycogen operon protein